MTDERRPALVLPEATLARELLAGDDVRAFCASLDLSPETDQELRALLTDDEHARAAGFPDSARAVRFARGRGVLRCLLGEVLGAPASSLRFAYDRDGKPSLAGSKSASGVEFNLSHAPGIVLVAIAQRRRVGCDVAWTEGSTRIDGVVARFFSPLERAAYCAAPPEHRRSLFSRIWVRKEAYLKGRGEGISEWIHTTDFTGDGVRGRWGRGWGTDPERLGTGVGDGPQAFGDGGGGRSDQDAWDVRDVDGLPAGYVGSIALERVRR